MSDQKSRAEYVYVGDDTPIKVVSGGTIKLTRWTAAPQPDAAFDFQDIPELAVPQETAIEKLRRAVAWLDTEPEYLLDHFPTPAALLEYFDLWSVYGVDGLDDISECIEEGTDPAPYNALVEKYALPWQTWDGKQWIDPPKRTA